MRDIEFEVEYHDSDGEPHIVLLMYSYRNRNIDFSRVTEFIAASIVDRVINRIQRYNGMPRNVILKNVGGYINGNNNGSNKSFNEFSSLKDVTSQAIEDIFEKIIESNDLVEIFDIEWQFTIDPNTLIFGAGGSFPIPKWVKTYRDTWVDQYATPVKRKGGSGSLPIPVKVNCAAYAIARATLTNTHGADAAFCRKALELQKSLNWGDSIDHLDLIKYVKVYKTVRICVLSPPIESATHDYRGDEYIYNGKDNIIFLYYYQNAKLSVHHFALCCSPIFGLVNVKKLSWCYFCAESFSKMIGHSCEQLCFEAIKSIRGGKKCEGCGHHLVSKKTHICFYQTCKTCCLEKPRKSDIAHRCPLIFKPQKQKDNYSFLVYDIESRFVKVRSVAQVIVGFVVDEDGYYTGKETQSSMVFYEHYYNRHVANLVCVKDIMTGQKWYFFGDDCIKEFVLFCLGYNGGYNIMLAHNASGYDSRLVFEKASKFIRSDHIKFTMRGSKFMEMTFLNCQFRDIMLQIPGSLKNLAKDFGCAHQKGDFPFMFNVEENYNYVGPIPDLSFFSLEICRTQKIRDDLIAWHASWAGRTDWNFREQLLSYCENDVDVASEIVKAYHDIWMAKGISPWLKPTGAGVVHLYMGLKAWEQLIDVHEPPANNTVEYYAWLNDRVHNDWWAVLTPYEHMFAKDALRGGRTEVKRPYYKLSKTDYDRGVRIMYVDVCSMYPYQQIANDFPVGVPTKYVYDYKYYPCVKHVNSFRCDCKDFIKGSPKNFVNTRNLTLTQLQPSVFEMYSWFGIVCVTLIPPKNLLHPVLILWDENMKKCVATLEDSAHVEIVIGTNSLHACLNVGYTVVKVHCYHEYSKGNFWRDPTLKLYLDKMMYSKNAPDTQEAKDAFVEKWSKKYGTEFGDMITKSWPLWGKMPAKKFVSKIIINSVWGKHAQRTLMPNSVLYDSKIQKPEIAAYFKNCTSGVYEHSSAIPISETKTMYTSKAVNENPNLHKQYLPAAVMVPEYGRLQLWEQLHRVGERALYCDTDSIIYVYDPELENIETGDMVGDWEVEDICTDHGHITEFVGWGPKTYGIRCSDGYESIKAKGVALKRATDKIFNFETMKNGVLAFISNSFEKEKIFVPQTNFVWSFITGMKTTFNLKEIGIRKSELKGVLHNGIIYPFGYVIESVD